MSQEKWALKIASEGRETSRQGSLAVSASLATEKFQSVDIAVRALLPAKPLYCMHPDKIREAASIFVERFSGKTFYAVKSNPDIYVLQQLGRAGICHFDVASMVEIRLIRNLFPDADLAFMNTAKAREAIRSSYFDYGVRTFVLDSFQELKKIREETCDAKDLTLFVRLALPKGSSLHPLTEKFGAPPDVSVALLREVSKTAQRVGLSFHVGSQTMNPASYVYALELTKRVVRESQTKLDILDIGGGFPVLNREDNALSLPEYLDIIQAKISTLGLPPSCELWAEPGTALCGQSTTLVLRVELRKDGTLYLNDGGYGALFDCCWLKARKDMRAIYAKPHKKDDDVSMKAFKLYGPTCDSADVLSEPVWLPENIDEGDFVVISNMGAYGMAMQSGFNGFYSDKKVEIQDSGEENVLSLPRRTRK